MSSQKSPISQGRHWDPSTKFTCRKNRSLHPTIWRLYCYNIRENFRLQDGDFPRFLVEKKKSTKFPHSSSNLVEHCLLSLEKEMAKEQNKSVLLLQSKILRCFSKNYMEKKRKEKKWKLTWCLMLCSSRTFVGGVLHRLSCLLKQQILVKLLKSNLKMIKQVLMSKAKKDIYFLN